MRKIECEQCTKGWHTVEVNLRFKLYDIVQWCLNYDSSKGFFIDYNDKIFNSPLKIKFQSQEDMMMFIMIWIAV